jgi:hypothetical protein
MGLKKTTVEICHDEGYGDDLLLYLNIALRGKDMIGVRVVDTDVSEMLEFLLNEMQIHSVKMDGLHHYRFRTGWPMTRLIGTSPEGAVRTAMHEVKKQEKESQ